MKKYFSIIVFLAFFSINNIAFGESPPYRAWWPIVNEEIEFGARGFSTKDGDSSKSGIGLQKYGFGIGLTNRFFIEAEGHLKKVSEDDYGFDAYELGVRYEFTDTKQFNEDPNSIDFGLLFGFKSPKKNESYEIETRLLFYKRISKLRYTMNIIFEQEFGRHKSQQLEIAYANQLKYRLSSFIQPGIELFGRFGELGAFSYSKNQHMFGPGIFGFFELRDNLSLKYEISYLNGVSGVTPEKTFKWLFEFEHKF